MDSLYLSGCVTGAMYNCKTQKYTLAIFQFQTYMWIELKKKKRGKKEAQILLLMETLQLGYESTKQMGIKSIKMKSW